MHSKKGFTLIELLVVIAIIGILSVMVVTQLGGARVKARNSTAKSDVTEMGKAIEVYKSNNDEKILLQSNTAGGDSINNTTASANFATLFTGASSAYAVKITKTPSTDYTYTYKTSTVSGDATHPQGATSVGYIVSTSVMPEATGGSATVSYVLNGQNGSTTNTTIPDAVAVSF